MLVIPGHLVFLYAISLLQGEEAPITVAFTICYLCAALLQVNPFNPSGTEKNSRLFCVRVSHELTDPQFILRFLTFGLIQTVERFRWTGFGPCDENGHLLTKCEINCAQGGGLSCSLSQKYLSCFFLNLKPSQVLKQLLIKLEHWKFEFILTVSSSPPIRWLSSFMLPTSSSVWCGDEIWTQTTSPSLTWLRLGTCSAPVSWPSVSTASHWFKVWVYEICHLPLNTCSIAPFSPFDWTKAFSGSAHIKESTQTPMFSPTEQTTLNTVLESIHYRILKFRVQSFLVSVCCVVSLHSVCLSLFEERVVGPAVRQHDTTGSSCVLLASAVNGYSACWHLFELGDKKILQYNITIHYSKCTLHMCWRTYRFNENLISEGLLWSSLVSMHIRLLWGGGGFFFLLRIVLVEKDDLVETVEKFI